MTNAGSTTAIPTASYVLGPERDTEVATILVKTETLVSPPLKISLSQANFPAAGPRTYGVVGMAVVDPGFVKFVFWR